MARTLSKGQALVLALRPPTLLAGLAPVLLGLSFGLQTLWQQGQTLGYYHVMVSLGAILLVLLLQSAANLVNDAKDAENGIDSAERLGPVRAVQSGLLSKGFVRFAYNSCFILAAFLVLSLFMWTQDSLIMAVALLCGLAAFAYTAGPFPLSYFALGEITAFVFFGPVAVMGSAYLLLRTVNWDIGFWGMGSGAIAAAIMAINNYRDLASDRKAGKHTLATLLGPKVARWLPLMFLGLSLLLLFVYTTQRDFIGAGSLALVLGWFYLLKQVLPFLKQGQQANLALKNTAQFNLIYAIVFMIFVFLS